MSKSLIVRLISFFLVLTLGIATLAPMSAQAETLDELLRRQAELKRKEEQNRKALEQKKREASNLRELIGDLDGDISYTSSRIQNTEEQIAATNSVINLLIQDIQKQQTELDALSAKLKGAYVNLYQLSQTSTMELLLQSPNLEEALSQAEYIQAIQTDLRKNIDTVNALKTDLEKKKTDNESQKASLETLRQELDRSRAALTGQKSQKSYLLSLNTDQQKSYESALKDIAKQKIQVDSQVAAIYASFANGGNYGGTGGYPWASREPWVGRKGSSVWSCVGNGTNASNSSDCSRVLNQGLDTWYFYTRNCTSYAAWKWITSGKQNFLSGWEGPSRHAKYWPEIARARGLTVSSTPRAGDIVSWPGLDGAALYGHVAIVESVNGNTITISQYNAGLDGRFSTATKSAGYDPNLGTPSYIRQ